MDGVCRGAWKCRIYGLYLMRAVGSHAVAADTSIISYTAVFTGERGGLLGMISCTIIEVVGHSGQSVTAASEIPVAMRHLGQIYY